MIKFFLAFAALIGLGALFVVFVAPTFMPTATDVVTPDTNAIQYAQDVVDKVNKQTSGQNIPKSSGLVINMSGKGLASVPKEVFTQTDATTLDVSQNSLTGSLPAEVRLLANLEVLDLSDNQFTGVPAEIGQLSNLRVLDLSNNPITGLPNELANLKKLERLDLSGTNYSKADLKIITEGLSADVLVVTD